MCESFNTRQPDVGVDGPEGCQERGTRYIECIKLGILQSNVEERLAYATTTTAFHSRYGLPSPSGDHPGESCVPNRRGCRLERSHRRTADQSPQEFCLLVRTADTGVASR